MTYLSGITPAIKQGGNFVNKGFAGTYSIAAFDPITKEWGVAVESKFVAIGAVTPWAKAGVGAIATQ